MANTSPKRITPPTEVRYAWIFTADTEYDKDGKFQIEQLYADRDAAAPLIREIEEEHAFALADAERASRGKKVKEAPLPVTDLDDGRVRIKFASYAKGKDPKTGEEFTRTIPVYGPDGQPWDRTKEIGNGSICEIAWFGSGYNSPTAGAGVTLRLKAIRIVKYVPKGGQGAERYGFSMDVPADAEDGTEPSSAPAGENGDF